MGNSQPNCDKGTGGCAGYPNIGNAQLFEDLILCPLERLSCLDSEQ